MLILLRGKKMRAGALAVGVFLLVIGVVVFWIGGMTLCIDFY
jgi:hypothetical protein